MFWFNVLKGGVWCVVNKKMCGYKKCVGGIKMKQFPKLNMDCIQGYMAEMRSDNIQHNEGTIRAERDMVLFDRTAHQKIAYYNVRQKEALQFFCFESQQYGIVFAAYRQGGLLCVFLNNSF